MLPAHHLLINILIFQTIKNFKGENYLFSRFNKRFDQFQNDEAKIHLDKIIKLQDNLSNN